MKFPSKPAIAVGLALIVVVTTTLLLNFRQASINPPLPANYAPGMTPAPPSVQAAIASAASTVSEAPASVALAAPTPPTEPSPWQKFTVRMGVSELVIAAIHSGRKDAVSAAYGAALTCGAKPTEAIVLKQVGAMSRGDSDAKAREMAAAVLQALSSLQNSCGSVDSMQSAAELRRVGLDGTLGWQIQSASFAKGGGDSSRYHQAVVELLSNPQADPQSFDQWLNVSLWSRTSFGQNAAFESLNQRHLVEDLVYAKFFPDEPEDSFRKTSRCAVTFKCPSFYALSAQQRNSAAAMADQLEGAIRSQRWGVIFGG